MPTVIRDPTPAWLKPENASVFDSYWTRIARAIAPWVGGDDPASQVMGIAAPLEVPGGLTPLRQLVKGAKATATKAANKVIRAYHGSPHDFEMFALSKIGTGEGAQAYGHGLYFAENEATAQAYRDALKWRGSNWDDPAVIAGRVLEEHGGNKAAAIQQLEEANRRNLGFKASEAGNAKRQQAIEIIRDAKQVKGSANQGRLYEVNIKADPEHFLDLDAPLTKQPAVADRLRDVVPVHPEMTGADAYAHASRDYGSDAAASDAMRISGIPGMKYLDQGSRGAAGGGTRNYVVFDAKLIDIVKKYGVAGALAGGLINESQARQMRAQGMS